jgi:hypothetical protein
MESFIKQEFVFVKIDTKNGGKAESTHRLTVNVVRE